MTASTRYGWFSTAQVGDSTVFPADYVFDGVVQRTNPYQMGGIRNYYQRRYPGRKFAVRSVSNGVRVTRLPDHSESPRGRPPALPTTPGAPSSPAQQRQLAYRARRQAAFAHAMSAEGSRAPSPEVIEFRRKALFQLQNTAALAAESYQSRQAAAWWRFRLRADMVAEIHPNRAKAAAAVAKLVSARTGADVRVELTESHAGMNFGGHWLAVGDVPVLHPAVPEPQAFISLADILGAAEDDEPIGPSMTLDAPHATGEHPLD